VLREAFALEAGRLPEGSDAVVIARPDARRLAEDQGLAGVHAALSALVDKVPGVGASASPGPETPQAGADSDEPGE
jgi:ribonuclease P protein component